MGSCPGMGEGCQDSSPLPCLPLQLGRLLKIPVLKFLLHSASYLWFLIFLLGESLAMETQLSTFRGRSRSVWETSLHMVWVTGTCMGRFNGGSPPPEGPPFFTIGKDPNGGPRPINALAHITRPLQVLAHQGIFPLHP